VAGLLVGCLVLWFWWAGKATPSGVRVAHRLDGKNALKFEPSQAPTEKIKIGPSTRTALRVPLHSSIECDIDPVSTRIRTSIGGRGLAYEEERLSFVLSAKTESGWHRVLEDTLNSGRSGWIDYDIDLAKLDGPVSRLRLETSAVERENTSELEAYWGSLMLEAPPNVWRARLAHVVRSLRQSTAGVILISLDTLGADHLGRFSRIAGVSPNIDTLFDRSFSFRRAYSSYPNTPVSHASIFTGLYPVHHQVYETQPWLRSDTLAHALAEQGYFTAAITEDAFVSSDFGFDYGFDWYDNGLSATTVADDPMLGTSRETFEKAKAWLDRYGRERPYFLFVHTYEVHAPYVLKDDVARRFTDQLDPGYEGPYQYDFPGGLIELAYNSGKRDLPAADLNRIRALYSGEINYLDRVVGDFIEYLHATFAEPPLVIVLADHGEELGEHGKLGHGETLHGTALHVPLAFYWPEHITPGTSQAVVQLVDVAPTVLDLLHIPPSVSYDGRSRAGDIAGHPEDRRNLAFSELRTSMGDCQKLGLDMMCEVNRLAVQSDRLKLITSQIPKAEALYDLDVDPAEMQNVADAFPRELEELRDALNAYVSDRFEGATPRKAEYNVDDATRERLRALGYSQ